LTGLEDSYNQLSDHQGEIGARIIRLNTARDMLDSTSFELEITLSKYEDADITEAITDLRVSQSALEAVLTSAGRVFDVNIFNYL
jgi:flagellin-like hook-associated protein FlgL